MNVFAPFAKLCAILRPGAKRNNYYDTTNVHQVLVPEFRAIVFLILLRS